MSSDSPESRPAIEPFGVSKELIQKYAVPGPRYTSYPTAVEFDAEFSDSDWREEIRNDVVSARRERTSYSGVQDGALSLYFHIPFCYTMCYFCACHKVIPRDRSVVDPYIEALVSEINTYKSLVNSDTPVEQIHWGGGSPDYLSPEEITRLHGACLAAFGNLTSDADISVELDPRNTTREHIKTFAEVGFNRLSFGVQDFDPRVQTIINRVQSYELTRDMCEWGREFGFHGINIDLVYGLPNQSLQGLADTLEKIIELRPNRIALYGYAHVTWIKKVQKALERAHLPTPEERISLFMMALDRLTEAGYEYIGMDHFALPSDSLAKALASGKLNRNFMGYTTHRGARIIGLGASSISSLPSAYAQNLKDVDTYQQQIEDQGLAIQRGVKRTKDDRMRGEIIESILCRGEVDISEFESKWEVDFNRMFESSIDRLSELSGDQLVTIGPEEIRLTRRGRLFARNVAMAFDAYLARHQEGSRRVFSQAV